MTDIAKIGFEADSAGIVKATKDLGALVVASAKAEVAAKKVEKSATSAALKIAQASEAEASAALKAALAMDKVDKAAVKAAKGVLSTAQAATGAALALDRQAAAALAMARNNESAALEVQQLETKLASLEAASARAASGMNMFGAANDNAMMKTGMMQSNVTNMAAQFQDIGVTAAMGMNPMMIGLQQGAQMAMVLQSAVGPAGAAGAVKVLASAFASVLSPLSLMTIGLTAALAAGLQMVDWTATAKAGLYGMADILDAMPESILAVGAALTIAFSPAIFRLAWAGFTMITGAIASMTLAMLTFAAANPFGAFVIAVTLAVGALFYFRDEMTQILGFDLIEVAGKAIDALVGFFVGGYRGVVKTWGLLPNAIKDLSIQAANGAITAIEFLINRTIKGINFIVKMTEEMTGISIGHLGDVKLDRMWNGFAGNAAHVGDTIASEISGAIDEKLGTRAIKAGAKYGMGLLKGVSDTFRGWGDAIGVEDGKKKKDKTKAEKAAKPDTTYDDLMKESTAFIVQQQHEAAQIGMTTEQSIRYKNEVIWLGEALGKLKDPTQEQTDALREQATAMAEAELNVYALKQSYEAMQAALAFAKETTKGFLTDLRTSLMQGKSIWETFGNAVINVLNKIADKLMDSIVNGIFQGSSGGGFLGSMFSMLMSAKGNAFSSSGAMAFANGGAFSNSVVSQPTAFQMGRGGGLGVMGEAGPEAVMPLQRGPDGALGVKSVGGSGGSQRLEVVITAEEGDMFRPRVKAIANDELINVMQAGLSAFNDQLPDRVQQIARDERVR